MESANLLRTSTAGVQSLADKQHEYPLIDEGGLQNDNAMRQSQQQQLQYLEQQQLVTQQLEQREGRANQHQHRPVHGGSTDNGEQSAHDINAFHHGGGAAYQQGNDANEVDAAESHYSLLQQQYASEELISLMKVKVC